MLLNNRNVAIIGAGPVGLMLANLLQQRGAAVTVYERDKNASARIWGGTLDLHKGSGQDALARAGLLDAYFSLSLAMGVKFADIKGRIMAVKSVTPENKLGNPEINRNQLRKMLLDHLVSGTVQWNRKLIDLEVKSGHWQLIFENNIPATADIVIVANGGMSKVRRFVTEALVEDTGSFIVQGEVENPGQNCPGIFNLCDHHRLMVAHQGNLLVVNPCNNGALSYGFIFKQPTIWNGHKNWDHQTKEEAANYLIGRLTGWSGIYEELILNTSTFVGLPTRKLPLQQKWNASRPLPITLIGDAAHLMPPFAGKGVNIGLLDSLILSENLLSDEFGSIQEAINGYEQKMFKYAAAASRTSSENEVQMIDPAFDFRDLMM